VAELFRHTDPDGDQLAVLASGETFGHVEMLTVSIGDEKGWRSAAYLDRDAALRLAAALQEHFNGQGETR
jgi:hypothetical protein